MCVRRATAHGPPPAHPRPPPPPPPPPPLAPAAAAAAPAQTIVLDFRRPDERTRFLSFVGALLPVAIAISHQRDPARADESSTQETTLSVASAGDLAVSRSANSPDRVSTPERRSSPMHSGAVLDPAALLPPLDLPPLNPRNSRGLGLLTSNGRLSAGNPAVVSARPYFSSSGQSLDVKTEALSIFVGSWNMGEAVAPVSLDAWIIRDSYDLYAIATQECTDEHWWTALDSHLGPSYVRVAERRMGDITSVVYTHRRHATKITGVETSFTPTGVLGVGTNKVPAPPTAHPAPPPTPPTAPSAHPPLRPAQSSRAAGLSGAAVPLARLPSLARFALHCASHSTLTRRWDRCYVTSRWQGAVAIALCIRGIRLCIVNAHLAAHHDKLLERNRHVQEITKQLRLGVSSLELPLQYHTIW